MSRIYRALLLAYPQPFRRRFGQAMADAFEQELRETHGRGRARSLLALLWRSLGDSLATSLQMRWAAWRGRPGPPLSRRETNSWRWLGYAGGSGSRDPGRGDGRRDSEKMLDRAGRPAFFDTLLRDLKFALRSLQGNPGFTAVVVLSLGLGIGATSTIFSALNPILLRPLPFADPDRLVAVHESPADDPERRGHPSPDSYHAWRENNTVFEQIELVNAADSEFTFPGIVGVERKSVQWVSPGLFGMLGVAPILGRNFVEEDTESGADRIILSYGFWQRRFGGDPDILGQRLADTVVVGVMPPGFRIFPWSKPDFWSPLTPAPGGQNFMRVIGRLKPGVSVKGARTQLDAIPHGVFQSARWAAQDRRVRVEPLRESWSFRYASNLYLLLGAAFLLLMIACSNVASLLVGRAASRHREIVTRAALGAGRLRLMRQMLTEAIVLALLGGALGVLIAHAGTRLFVILAPTAGWSLPAEEIRVDSTVLGFSLGLSLLTVVLFGMVPALRASKPDLAVSLKTGVRGSAGGSRPLVRELLVGSQIALTFVLLAGAALMINSLVRLAAADQGFNPEHLLRAVVELEGERYLTREGRGPYIVSPEVEFFYQEVLDRLRAVPGVEAAELATASDAKASVRRLPEEAESGRGRWDYNEASPGFFAVMGIPLLRGRSFTDRDIESAPWVAIINEALARLYFPDEDPIGKSLQTTIPGWRQATPASTDKPREIVGVVGDYRVNQRQVVPPRIYVPTTQHPTEYYGQLGIHTRKQLVLRTTLDPTSVVADVRRIVADVDPGVAVFDIQTWETLLYETARNERFWMRTLGIFATLALVVATIGIYGVVAYAVAQRTHEIGVRMALGAQRTDVLKMVIRQGMVMTVVGVIVGVLGAVAATRLLSSWLYEIEPTDPATFVAVAVVLIGIALLATYVPARGATRVDPVNSIRSE